MPCLYPIPAWMGPGRKATVKSREGFHDLPGFFLPCGSCDVCVKNRTSSNVVRLFHHYVEHFTVGCMVTLTYDNSHLPPGGSLRYEDIQLYHKRLRKRLPNIRLSFFCACEYGSDLERPHYHILYFGYNPDDVFNSQSALIDSCWGKGSHDIQPLNLGTISYAAQYLMKKEFGARANAHYGSKEPERCVWSKGIGKSWFEKYGQDLYIDDCAILDGSKVRVPAYYDKLLKMRDEKLGTTKFEDIKRSRVARALEQSEKDGRWSYDRSAVHRRQALHLRLRNKTKKRGTL